MQLKIRSALTSEDLLSSARFSCSSSFPFKYGVHDLLLPDLVEVSSQALNKSGLKSEDISFVLSSSFAAHNLGYEEEIGGPRIGHQVQKELRLNNAWVIDACDSSLSTMLDLVASYLSAESSRKYALIVKAENHSMYDLSALTHLALSDGVAALVLEKVEGDRYFSFQEDQQLPYDGLRILWNDQIKEFDDFKGTCVYPCKETHEIDRITAQFFANSFSEQDINIYETSNSSLSGEYVRAGFFSAYAQLSNLTASGSVNLLSHCMIHQTLSQRFLII